MKNLFVITGGPGAGKTTLLNALSANGYKTIPETAKGIIREETETDGEALPWKNKPLYTDKMIAMAISSNQLPFLSIESYKWSLSRMRAVLKG